LISRAVASRYAAALLGIAWEEGAVELVESNLGLIGYVFEANPELKVAYFHPLLPASRKSEIVRQIFQDKINDLTFSFLNLLIDKRREEVILYAEEEYVRLANERRGLVEAHIVSAAALTPDEVSSLKEKLVDLTGKSVQLVTGVDPSLIGGVLARIGDRVLDGTVKGCLENLREQMIGRIEPSSGEFRVSWRT